MRRISWMVFSLGLMLAGAVPFVRGETPATQDSVQLTFGWPDAYGKGEASGGLKGRVIHVLSHFARQHSKEDSFVLQNLALNFLLESRLRRIKAKKRKKK